jgi:hypothetical protein
MEEELGKTTTKNNNNNLEVLFPEETILPLMFDMD